MKRKHTASNVDEDVLLAVAQNLPVIPAAVRVARRLYTLNGRFRANAQPGLFMERASRPAYVLARDIGQRGSRAQMLWAAAALAYQTTVSEVVSGAASAGRLDNLQFLLDTFGDTILSSRATESAVTHGQLAALKWLVDHNFSSGNNLDYDSIRTGRLDILEFIVESRMQLRWTNDFTMLGALYGHMHIVQWAAKRYAPLCARTFAAAVSHGDIGKLQELLDMGCPFDETACKMAAFNNNLPVLKWLRKHGVPWDSETIWTAQSRGATKVLKWALKHGCHT